MLGGPCGRKEYMQRFKSLLTLIGLVYVWSALLACKENGPPMITTVNDDILRISMPLQGIYITPNTPGSKVPSHGTTNFGETYAIDFVMINDIKGIRKPYKSSMLKYLLKGVPLSDFYGWGRNVYSPINGKVIAIQDNFPEREIVNLWSDLQYMQKATKEYISSKEHPEKIAGNYVMLEIGQSKYGFLAHLVPGSILVKPGEFVHSGQLIGRLGHSGNSTMPHLHMQFMDSYDFTKAKGLPFQIIEYKVLRNDKWEKVQNSIPTDREIITN